MLVTGATGFVGGRIAAALRGRGDDVLAAVRTPSDALDALDVEQRVGDLQAIDAGWMDGVDAVIHSAAAFSDDLEATRAVNRDGTRQVAHAAREAGVRFVHISTTSVYRPSVGDADVDEDTPLVTEGSSPNTGSSAGGAYGITKAEAEREVVGAVGQGLSAAILRPPAVLGAGPTSTWGTTVPRRVRDGVDLPWPHERTYAWVHVEDLTDAALAAAASDTVATVHVVGGHTTFGRYLAAVAAVLPGSLSAPAPPASTGAMWQGRYTTDRLPRAFGIRPVRDFDTAMEEIAASWAGEPPAAG